MIVESDNLGWFPSVIFTPLSKATVSDCLRLLPFGPVVSELSWLNMPFSMLRESLSFTLQGKAVWWFCDLVQYVGYGGKTVLIWVFQGPILRLFLLDANQFSICLSWSHWSKYMISVSWEGKMMHETDLEIVSYIGKEQCDTSRVKVQKWPRYFPVT